MRDAERSAHRPEWNALPGNYSVGRLRGDVDSVGDLPDGSGIYVEDGGPGIPVGECEAVFEPGYTTDADGGARFEFRNVELFATSD